MELCPVPKSQRPIEEFKELCNSWFFSWPLDNSRKLYRNLIISWIIISPITIVIQTGNLSLRSRPIQLIILSLIISLFLPILLLSRQLLGWNYIHKRLISEIIEYEESGWYDGQVWEKPNDWREKDILVANYEVKPIISRVNQGIIFTLFSTLLFFSIYYICLNYIVIR